MPALGRGELVTTTELLGDQIIDLYSRKRENPGWLEKERAHPLIAT